MKIYQTMFKSMIPEKGISKDILEKHIKEKTCPLTHKDNILGYLVDYKENALVGLLINKVKFLEAQVDYLKSELAYTKKYEVNHDIK